MPNKGVPSARTAGISGNPLKRNHPLVNVCRRSTLPNPRTTTR